MDHTNPAISSSEKSSFFEVCEEFKFEIKQLHDFLFQTNSKNFKIFNTHLLKMNEFLEELSSQHLSFLSKYEKSQSQHFFEAKELNLSLKNHHNQKKTSLKLQIHHLECQTTLQSKEIEQKNLLITELRKSFEEHLKSEKKLKKTMEFWFKRQLEKIELNLQEIQLDIHSKESLSNIYHKLKKYKTSMPWKANNMASSVVFSIASTPFSNYSAISSNSLMKTPQNSSLNNAFYIISSQKQQDSIKNTPIEKDLFKDVMTVTQKEALFLKLVNGKPSQDDFFNDFSHKSVKLEDILNVAKNGDDSSMDCDFLKDIPKNNNNNNKRLPQNSLEKLLKTLNFTGKLSENNPIPLETNKREISFENSHKIIKDLNREIYQHLGETLALSDSLIDSINNDENHINDINIGTYRKDLKGKKVPRLNLEKLHKREGSIHSFSPSYRKNAERSQYLKELFEGEKDKILVKRIKQTNKSMDLSRKPMNFSFIQSRINEKTNKFICNLLQKPNKHSKNNLSLIENCQKDESFIKKSNIKIVNLLKHEEKNENFGQFQKNEDFDKNAKFEKKLPLKEKTNFLNIVAPTSNINVFISGGDFEEKESFNLNPSTRPYKNNRLMKLLSQVNQNKRAKENMNEGFSLGNIMGVLKEKGKEYGLKLRRSKHE